MRAATALPILWVLWLGAGCGGPTSTSLAGGGDGAAAPEGGRAQEGSTPAQHGGDARPGSEDEEQGGNSAGLDGSDAGSEGEGAGADGAVDADPGVDATVATSEPGADAGAPFSVVLLPDTQYYTSKQADNADNTYRAQARWIRDHRATERIQMAIHLGDITAHNRVDEWTVADRAHAILDQAGVPYSVTTGNHDYLSDGWFARRNTRFEETFPASRFAGKPWYGGALGGSSVNNYTLFEVDGRGFLVLSLEYAPRKDALCRAEDIVASHPDRRVIVATHCYLTSNGAYATNCPKEDYLALGANGAAVWDELVSRHSNIFMVVSGHVGESAYVSRAANGGNTVHQMVVDYQFEAACSARSEAQCSDHCRSGSYTGNGWLRQLILDPTRSEVRARTLSVEAGNPDVFPDGEPTLFCSELNTHGEDRYAADPLAQDHHFSFPLDLGPLPPYQREDLGRRAFVDRTVNSAGAGDQLAPRLAISPRGDFVAVWEDDASDADGAGNHDIKMRGFAAGGCGAFAERVVNPVTDGQQRTPAVAMDEAGDFVVVWADDRDLNGVYQVHARGFFADGSERFPTFTVNSAARGQQRSPDVASAPDGRFVVVWEDAPDGDGRYQILARGFHADGSERFSDRSVHDEVAGTRRAPAVGMDADAGFVLAWQDDSDGNGSYQIHARGFLPDGRPRFARRVVNSVAAGQQRDPDVGVAASGDFVVVWEDDPESDGSSQILGRGFFADGSPRLADFEVPGPAAGDRVDPALAMRADGAFVVSWRDDSDGNGVSQIHARAFAADGTEWRSRWTVNRLAAGQQVAPHAALAGNTLVVAWQDDLDGNGSWQILARGVDLP